MSSESFFALICFIYCIKSLYEFYKFDYERLSSKKYYYAYVLGQSLLIITFGLSSWSLYYNNVISEYVPFFFFTGLFISTYYLEDITKNKKIGYPINDEKIIKMIILGRRLLIILFLFIIFAVIRKFL